MLRTRYSAGLALMAAGLLGGCQPDRSDAATRDGKAPENPSTGARPAEINVTAKDFAFDAPARVPAGAVTIQLVNNGGELHHAQLVKLEEGKTLADVGKALKNPAAPPSWMKFVGGPNAVTPGKSVNATSVLEPGRYAYMCFIFGPDKVPHAAKGMMREFEVVDSGSTTAQELPAADVTINLVDYDFEPSAPLSPGKRTILVTNGGPQPHELALLKMAPGKTVEDFAHWAEGGMKGPPPAEPIGGVVFLDKGQKGTFTADLEAGNYGLICFLPDAKDGKPHLAHGMMKTIKVG
jgi:uncharacterized cupredoxin-like copper-binding protein